RVPNSPAALAFYKAVKKLTGVEIKVEKKKSGFDFLKKGSPNVEELKAPEQEKPKEKKAGLFDFIFNFFKKN
ncbi:MAG: hypothetical protein Q7K42_06320, partial [Candidatus Diapherotrites archaeon]|nr:hypothetical protein [Candidatus Diapherotrites archaeon]